MGVDPIQSLKYPLWIWNVSVLEREDHCNDV